MLHSTRHSSAILLIVLSAGSLSWINGVAGLSQVPIKNPTPFLSSQSRRDTIGWLIVAGGATLAGSPAWSAAAVQDTMSVDNFLRTGVDIGGNMGVSSQAGKTKPVTGVFLR
jgi:hypothetical protein